MTRDGKERTLRKAIDHLVEAESLLRSVAACTDAYHSVNNLAGFGRENTFTARKNVATALGLLITHKH